MCHWVQLRPRASFSPWHVGLLACRSIVPLDTFSFGSCLYTFKVWSYCKRNRNFLSFRHTNVSVKFSGSAPLHRAASVTPQFLQFFFEWSLWNFKSCMRSDCNEVLVVDCAVKFGERFYMYSVSCAFAYPYFILMPLTIWRLLLTRKGLLLLEKWTWKRRRN
jgi:hypothetical protein